MQNEDVNYLLENKSAIEEKVAYQFNFSHNKLFIQAFTRKSFTAENAGFEDNEILEFYGDQIVNTVITKWMYESSFTVPPKNYNDEFFYSEKSESDLSRIRQRYISKSALAHCIDILDLDDFLLLGKSDEQNEVWRSEKVRCDLFESIIGAIAVDSNWDWSKLEKSCKAMWGMLDFSENYIDNLYDRCDEMGLKEPQFSIIRNYYNLYNSNSSFEIKLSIYAENQWLPLISETGTGDNEQTAKMDAAKKTLSKLNDYQMRQAAGNFTFDNAVQTLNTLYLKKFISQPEFNFSVSSDDDGNQIWRCECFISEYESWEGYNQAGIGEDYKKADAKKTAAYDMLCFMFGIENESYGEDDDNDWEDD